MSIVVHGSHHVVSSRFGGGYEPDRTLDLVGDVDLLINVLVQFIKVFVHLLSYIY
jgi:hypothetical protein